MPQRRSAISYATRAAPTGAQPTRHEPYLEKLIQQGFADVKAAAGKEGKLNEDGYDRLVGTHPRTSALGALREDIARFLLERGDDTGSWEAVSLRNPLGDGRTYEQVAADFARRVVRYDRWLRSGGASKRRAAPEPLEVIWVKRARNHSEPLAQELLAKERGPARRPTGEDGLTRSERSCLIEVALRDHSERHREVLLESCPRASLPSRAVELLLKEDKAMRSDPEGSLGAQFSAVFAVYRSATSHTIIGYAARARAVVDGCTYERTLALGLDGEILSDREAAG